MSTRPGPASVSEATGGRVRSPIETYLERLHARHAGTRDGAVADLHPRAGQGRPGLVRDLHRHHRRPASTRSATRARPFTIQSISKPFIYGLALEDHGRDAVLAKIGVEPTGDAFNSISLAPGTGRPLNPMINAGAIAADLAGRRRTRRRPAASALLAMLSLLRRPRASTIDDAVYESERETGHRNRAIGHMLRNFDILDERSRAARSTSTSSQCSIAVDCRDLALMAATLANGGVNPRHRRARASAHELVESVLSVMTTCGMYDYAGEWVYRGRHAGQERRRRRHPRGAARASSASASSRRALDARGNSVRGVAVCTDLSRDFNLHFLRVPRSARAAHPRATYDLADGQLEAPAQRGRARGARRASAAACASTSCRATSSFAAVEASCGGSSTRAPPLAVRRSSTCERVARDRRLRRRAARRAAAASFARPGRAAACSSARSEHARFVRAARGAAGDGRAAGGRCGRFPDLDAALEWCEDRLLGRRTSRRVAPRARPARRARALPRPVAPRTSRCSRPLLERRALPGRRAHHPPGRRGRRHLPAGARRGERHRRSARRAAGAALDALARHGVRRARGRSTADAHRRRPRRHRGRVLTRSRSTSSTGSATTHPRSR